MGGPMSRMRNETISSTILGLDDGDVICPRILQLGLDFEQSDPCSTIRRLLKKSGFDSPEELRFVVDLPAPMVCTPSPSPRRLKVKKADPDEVLREAFLLGLCTSVCFDPARSVLWTTASLTRRLDLFDTQEFYA